MIGEGHWKGGWGRICALESGLEAVRLGARVLWLGRRGWAWTWPRALGMEGRAGWAATARGWVRQGLVTDP